MALLSHFPALREYELVGNGGIFALICAVNSKRMDRFVVISGCSGGGKSTLLAELGRRGHAIVPEPGRRIVQEELEADGSALPWRDGVAFARRLVDMALADRCLAHTLRGWVFFDRGLIDAAAALEHLTGERALVTLDQSHRFNRRVFFAPPWQEIYRIDEERRHSLEAAVAEYERLAEAYTALGYQIRILPKAGVADRADFVLSGLA
jgi:predicted ATPase